MNEIYYLNELLPNLNGEQFKMVYIIVATMLSEESDLVELPVGYLMQLLNKSERSVKRLIYSLVDKGVIFYENGLFGLYLNLSEEDEEEDADNQEEKPAKRIGYV